jgi:hypothetical protein
MEINTTNVNLISNDQLETLLLLFLNETLILKGTSALDGSRGGEEGGISCELFTLSQMISFFGGEEEYGL